jgi:hypothetical protein
MKKVIQLLLVLISLQSAYGQDFEGKMTYRNTFKSRIAGMTDEQLTAFMGTTQEYFTNGHDYKSMTKGSPLLWQLYINSENKLYNKPVNAESAIWIDGASNTDEVLKAEINKGVTEVLGYRCDELILTCKSGIQKYYYSPEFKANPELFMKHKYGNYYYVLSRTHALPLKLVVETAQFSMESIVQEIKPMKLENSVFELPANLKLVKSPD